MLSLDFNLSRVIYTKTTFGTPRDLLRDQNESLMPRSKKNRKKKCEPTKNGVSRRSALKMGAVAGAVTVLTSRKSLATAFAPPFQTVAPTPPPEPAICTTFTGSPATRPFIQQLPIPPALQPTTHNPAPTQAARQLNETLHVTDNKFQQSISSQLERSQLSAK